MNGFKLLDNHSLGEMNIVNGVVTRMRPLENSMRGIVTPLKQKMRNMNGTGFKIDLIATDENTQNLFMPNEFPKMEKTADGIFFQPLARVISTSRQYFIKWFSLSKDMEFSHDHDYQYARINEDGFLMKVVVPRTSEYISDYEVKYVTPVNNISVSEIQTNQGMISASTIDIHGEVETSNVPSIKYVVSPFIPQNQNEQLLQVLMNRNEFIKTYLHDILEQD